MLHLNARLEMVAAGGHDGLLADALPSAERSECLIRQRYAIGNEFLMDSHEIAFAGVQ